MVYPMPAPAILIAQRLFGRDPRFRLAFKFLAAKGYVSTSLAPMISYRGKLLAADMLWACETVEPLWLQFLPAVLVRFPGHFDAKENWPQELREIAQALKAADGAAFRGFEFSRLKEWLEFQPVDRRSKKMGSKTVSFRLSEVAQAGLSQIAARENVSLTEAIHFAIETSATMASATRIPSQAALVIPPAYPAPSPVG